MCGRTGLTLCAEDVRGACAYKNRDNGKYVKPDWKDEHNFGKQYIPSTNIAPTDITPVIVSAANFDDEEPSTLILKPMMWGMIPPWHKGNYKSHGLTTNNCRIETMTTSKLYGNALRKGNRCVVVAEGFYEWQTVNSSKQPYYIYSQQKNENVKMDDPVSWDKTFDENNGWNGIELMKMAGLYDIWENDEGCILSYSVITMESDKTLGWLHHRTPAILDTGQQVADWLNTKEISHSDCLSILKPPSLLAWYPVSTLVNNSRNKSLDCNKRIEIDGKNKIGKQKVQSSASQNLMNSWLKGTKRKDSDDANIENSKTMKRE